MLPRPALLFVPLIAGAVLAASCGHAPSDEVSYHDRDGNLVTVRAVPGQILLLANGGAAAAKVESLVEANGGNVIDELPNGGVYLVGVAPGDEASFIASVRGSAEVFDVLPDLAIEPQGAGLGVVDFFSGQVDPSCPTLSHGEAVSRVLGVPDGPKQFAIGWKGKGGAAAAAAIAQGVDALVANGATVLNVSVGAPDDLTEIAFLNALGAQLQAGSIDLASTVIVLSAGNYGQDLGPALKKLFDENPKLVGHLVVVGSSKGCVPIKNSMVTDPKKGARNFSSITTDSAGNPLVTYAPGENVAIPGSKCPPQSGTSFAAPAVSKAIQGLLNASPGAAVGDVVKKFLKAGGITCTLSVTGSSTAVHQAHVTGQYHGTESTQLTATFQASGKSDASGTGGTLTGMATLNETSLALSIADSCCMTTWSTMPATGTTPISGTWKANADGSITVALTQPLANLNAFAPTINFNETCSSGPGCGSSGSGTSAVPFFWPGCSGKLVSGVYDATSSLSSAPYFLVPPENSQWVPDQAQQHCHMTGKLAN